VQAAIDEGIPALGAFLSRDGDEYSDRPLSAMGYEFGGHREKANTGER
jgi:6-phosphogluconate dehydrogenase (decarboxylating)